MRFYAFLDTEVIVDIGEWNTYDDAFENEPPNTHWVLSREGLEKLVDSLRQLGIPLTKTGAIR